MDLTTQGEGSLRKRNGDPVLCEEDSFKTGWSISGDRKYSDRSRLRDRRYYSICLVGVLFHLRLTL